MALYKQLKDGSWLKAEKEVILPNGVEINENNQIEGWEFSDPEPKEYLIWLDSQKEILKLKGE